MIQYALKCAEGHRFDSWFQSAAAYEKLVAGGMVSCAVCGASTVEKSVMAPRLSRGEQPAPRADLSVAASPQEKALAEMRRKVEQNADYVGRAFASEARSMHEGETETRAIWGEARPDEARKLLEDGVPVMPLPFMPSRKTN
ncbi:MAG: DUF1178 family protein [Rhodobacteraceae bacterium]|nr:DUF1178 family protein [Paracoccaceae bacterium]